MFSHAKCYSEASICSIKATVHGLLFPICPTWSISDPFMPKFYLKIEASYFLYPCDSWLPPHIQAPLFPCPHHLYHIPTLFCFFSPDVTSPDLSVLCTPVPGGVKCLPSPHFFTNQGWLSSRDTISHSPLKGRPLAASPKCQSQGMRTTLSLHIIFTHSFAKCSLGCLLSLKLSFRC